MIIEHLLTSKALAERLSVTEGCLAKWRITSEGPRFIRVQRRIAYDPKDVQEWLDARPGQLNLAGGGMTGGGATPPESTGPERAGNIGRYHGPDTPRKTIRFISDGQPFTTKGKVAAFLLALIAAGYRGVAHIEVMPWLNNAADAAKALRSRGVLIETRKGQPSRWVLQSRVREVQP
jgi:hypothetical protein